MLKSQDDPVAWPLVLGHMSVSPTKGSITTNQTGPGIMGQFLLPDIKNNVPQLCTLTIQNHMHDSIRQPSNLVR